MTIYEDSSYRAGKDALSEASLEAIKNFCKEKQGRVTALAEATASTRPEVSRWFSGGRRPRPDKLAMMAEWMRHEQEAEAKQKKAQAEQIRGKRFLGHPENFT